MQKLKEKPTPEKQAVPDASKAASTEDPQVHNKDWVPFGIFTFADLAVYKQAQETAGELYEATDELQQIIWNIMNSDEVTDKGAAVAKVAAEFERLVKTAGQTDKGLFGLIKQKIAPEKKEAPQTRFLVFKDDSGEYRWVSAYSNNFRDDDRPAEIISAQSHRAFVDKVDKGLAAYPELWLWHEKDWKIGDATWVGVDEIGDGIVVALAAGHFDSDKQWVAEALARSGMNGVSHGMPVETIARDRKDKTVIVAHETHEISPLPVDRAANKLAGFTTLRKEADMTISDQKRRELAESMFISAETIAQIEESNKARADKGLAEGLETKDKSDEATPAPVAPEAVESKPVAEAPKGDPGDEPDELDPENQEDKVLEEVKESILLIAAEVKTISEGMGKALKVLSERTEALEKGEKARAEKELEETPSAAFNDIVKSIIGDKKAEVSEEDKLAQQKPKETAVPDESGLPSFISTLWQPGQ